MAWIAGSLLLLTVAAGLKTGSPGPGRGPDTAALDTAASDTAAPDTAALETAAPAGPDGVLADALRGIPLPATGNLSLALADTASGSSAVYAPDQHAFVMASVAKVGILAALLLRAEAEGRALTAEERADAQKMIQVSDNSAADRRWRSIGGAGGFAAANRVFGLTETVPGTKDRWGLTTTTASDQLRLLTGVTAEDSPLAPASRACVHQLMSQVQPGQDWGVSAAADPAGGTALKNGWLPRTDSGLWVINSIGVVHHDGHRLLIAVLCDGQTSQAAGIETVESAAAAAAAALTGMLPVR